MRDTTRTLTYSFRLLMALACVATVGARQPQSIDCVTPGCLDSSFGAGGVAAFDLVPGGSEFVHSMAVQPDGKIVTAGYGSLASGWTTMLVARVLSTGALDPTFGTAGLVKPQFTATADTEQANVVLLAPDLGGDALDFDVVVVGYAPIGVSKSKDPIYGCAIARLNSDGSPVVDFGNAGKVSFGFSAGTSAYCRAAGLDGNGRIVLAASSGTVVALARLYPEGTFDTTFGTSGRVLTSESSVPAELALTIDASGNILISQASVLFRRLPGGGADTSFGASGRVATGLTASGWASLALTTTGEIIVLGTIDNSLHTTKPPRTVQNNDIGVAKFDFSGHRITGFGVGGIATVDAGTSTDTPLGLALDGTRIVVAGWTFTAGPYPNDTSSIVVRLDGTGSPDYSFGTSGVVLAPGGGRAGAGVVVTEAGILLGGQTDHTSTYSTIARYLR